jgi:hypothetical protein
MKIQVQNPALKKEMKAPAANHPLHPLKAGPGVGDSVSFQGVEQLAKKVPDAFHKSGVLHKILELAGSNPTFFEVAFATTLMTTIRPLTVLAVPGAKKEDKQYAAVKSICSAVSSFALTALLYIPLAAVMKNLGNGKLPGFPFPKDSNQFKAFNHYFNYGSRFILAPLEAMILFKMIPPIMNKLFPNRKKSGKFDPPPGPFAGKLNQDQERLLAEFQAKYGKGVSA